MTSRPKARDRGLAASLALPLGLAMIGLAGTASAAPMSSADFVSAAGASDAYEIQAAHVLLAQTQDSRVKGFAQQMVEDHSRAIQNLKAAASAAGLAPPPQTPSGDQQKMLSALQSQKGADLDRSYVTQQVMAHTAALATAQAYGSSGSEPNLRRAALAATPMIQRHLEMAKMLKAALGAP